MRKVVSYILALLIMFDTILLVVSSDFLLTLGRKSYYISRFEANSYVDACTTSVKNGIADISLASGIPENSVIGAVKRVDVANGIQEVISDYFKYIEGKTSSTSIKVDTSAFTSKLNKSIRLYAKSSGTVLSDDTKQAVESYIKKCDNVFSSNLMQIPYFYIVSKYLGKLLGLCRMIVAFSAFLLVFLIATSLAAGNGKILLRLLYPIYGLSCAGALVAVPTAIVLFSGLPYHLSLSGVAGREIAGNLISGFFAAALAIGLLVSTAGIVSSFILHRTIKAH